MFDFILLNSTSWITFKSVVLGHSNSFWSIFLQIQTSFDEFWITLLLLRGLFWICSTFDQCRPIYNLIRRCFGLFFLNIISSFQRVLKLFSDQFQSKPTSVCQFCPIWIILGWNVNFFINNLFLFKQFCIQFQWLTGFEVLNRDFSANFHPFTANFGPIFDILGSISDQFFMIRSTIVQYFDYRFNSCLHDVSVAGFWRLDQYLLDWTLLYTWNWFGSIFNSSWCDWFNWTCCSFLSSFFFLFFGGGGGEWSALPWQRFDRLEGACFKRAHETQFSFSITDGFWKALASAQKSNVWNIELIYERMVHHFCGGQLRQLRAWCAFIQDQAVGWWMTSIIRKTSGRHHTSAAINWMVSACPEPSRLASPTTKYTKTFPFAFQSWCPFSFNPFVFSFSFESMINDRQITRKTHRNLNE